MTLARLLDTTPPSLLTTAACSGLRPAPDCRPRGAYPHLSYSSTPSLSDDVFVTHRSCSTVCLAKAHRCRGCKPHPATLAPAGSARGGSGGDEWSEALREKVPSGDQWAMRAAATANIDEASKRSAVRADPPVEWGGRRRRTSERETRLTVSPG